MFSADMDMRAKGFLMMAAAMMFPLFNASSQNTDDDADDAVFSAGVFEIVRVNPEIVEMLSSARQDEPNNIPMPKFAIRTSDNKFVMSIGGKVNPIFGYDLGNDLYNAPGGGIDFVTGSIPVPAQPGKKNDMFINPLNAQLDFTVVGFGGSENQVTGYIRLGMNGSSHQAVFKRAYLTWRGIVVGETATMMQDGLACQPPTIDPQGPCGLVGATAYSIQYASPSWSGFSFSAGLEMPTFYSSNGVYRGKDYRHDYYDVKVTDEANQLIPDVPVWVQYQASESNRVRLTGLLRNFAYHDLISDKTRNLFGWGAMLSGNFSFWKPLVFNFQGVYGYGIANYIQDIAGREISFTPDSRNVGRMKANPMMGLVFGASYNATDKLQFNVVGSYSRVWDVADYAVVGDENGIAGPNNYRYAVYTAANCFYRITSYLKWGVEYLYGRRATYGLGSGNDNRIQTQLSLTF